MVITLVLLSSLTEAFHVTVRVPVSCVIPTSPVQARALVLVLVSTPFTLLLTMLNVPLVVHPVSDPLTEVVPLPEGPPLVVRAGLNLIDPVIPVQVTVLC